MKKSSLKAAKKRHSAGTLSVVGEYSPIDLLLTSYFPTDQSFDVNALKQALNNKVKDFPDVKAVLLTLAYWAFLGSDTQLTNRKIQQQHKRLALVQTSTDSLQGEHAGKGKMCGFYSNKHSVYFGDNEDFVETVVHEGTHAAANLIMQNESKPYFKFERNSDPVWQSKVERLFQELSSNLDKIPGANLFLNIKHFYSENHYIAEFLARVFQHRIAHPNETYASLSDESQRFINETRHEFAQACHQWCVDFVNDYGICLLPSNPDYEADFDQPLVMNEADLAVLQQAHANQQSILAMTLDNAYTIEDSELRAKEVRRIALYSSLLSVQKVAAKQAPIHQLVRETMQQGALSAGTTTQKQRALCLLMAAKHGNESAIDFYLEQGLPAYVKDSTGRNLFYFLSANGRLELLEKYLKIYDFSNELQEYIQAAFNAAIYHRQYASLRYLRENFSDKIMQASQRLQSNDKIEAIRKYLSIFKSDEPKEFLSYLILNHIIGPQFLLRIACYICADDEIKYWLLDQIQHFSDESLAVTCQYAAESKDDHLFNAIIEKIDLYTIRPATVRHMLALCTIHHLPTSFNRILKSDRINAEHYSDTIVLNSSNASLSMIAAMREMSVDFTLKDIDGNTLVHRMAKGGNERAYYAVSHLNVFNLLSIRNNNGNTPIMLALKLKHVRVAKMLHLLDYDEQLSLRDKDGRTPIMIALLKSAGNNNAMREFAEELAQNRSLIKAANYKNKTMLHYAACAGSTTIVKQLITEQTSAKDVNTEDNLGYTALAYAIEAGKNDTAEYLIERQGTLDFRSKKQAITFFQRAIRNGASQPLITFALAQLSISFHDELQKIVIKVTKHAINLKIINQLPQLLGHLEHAGRVSLLHFCIKSNQENCAMILLASIEALSDDEYTRVIRLAATHGMTRIICEQEDQMPATALQTLRPYRRSPLHLAAIGGHYETTSLLCKLCELDQADYQDKTPFYLAVAHQKEQTALLLLDHGANGLHRPQYSPAAINLALKYGLNHLARRLLPLYLKSADAHQQLIVQDELGHSLLHLAIAGNCDSDVIHRLLSAGVCAKTVNSEGDTPLHLAVAFERSPKIIMLLLSYGAKIRVYNSRGKTPLQLDTQGVLTELAKVESDKKTRENLAPGWFHFLQGLIPIGYSSTPLPTDEHQIHSRT